MPMKEALGFQTELAPGYRAGALVLEVGMMAVAITYMVLAGCGLIAWGFGVHFPLQEPMVPDAALAGVLAGLCFLAWRQGWALIRWISALLLIMLSLYTLWHNATAGGPWGAPSWISGEPRVVSMAAVLLLLWAICCLMGTHRRWRRRFVLLSGVLMIICGLLSIGWLLLPFKRLGLLNSFASSPLVAITFMLLAGVALLAAVWRGSAPSLPIGGLARVAAAVLLVLSCLGWFVLSANAQKEVERQGQILLNNLELNTQQLMAEHIALLERLAALSEQTARDEKNPEWSQTAALLVERFTYLWGLALLDGESRIQGLRATNRETELALQRQLRGESTRAWLSIPGRAPRVMHLAEKPDPALLVSVPVGHHGRRLVAWVNLVRLLDDKLLVELGGFRATLGLTQPFLTLRAPGLPATDASMPLMPHLSRRYVGMPGGGRLVLNAYVDSQRLLWHVELLPASFGLAGLILSYLLALSLGFNRVIHRYTQTLRMFKRGLDASINGVTIADARAPHMPLIYVNEAFERITGYTAQDVMGRNCRFLQGPETEADKIDCLRKSLDEEREVRTLLRNYRRDGSVFWNQMTINPIRDERGRCTHFIGIQEDVTLEHEQAQRLAYQASHDSLTGLPNRASFMATLMQEIDESAATSSVLAVLYIDLDDFKPVNDGLGHDVGNQLLVAVAERFLEVLETSGTLARLVSDEFVVLLPGLTSSKAAEGVAERLLLALTRPFELAGEQVQISASIGLASSTCELPHPEALLQYADLAMHEAKRRGRNTWHWFHGEASGATSEHVVLRHELQQAIQEQQFELHYQPIVEAVSGTIRSVEALIRWHHPSRGLVPPDVFIPLAEQTGQIIALGRWVLHHACHDMAGCAAKDETALVVAVNISPLQFRREDFVADVRQALADSGLAPERLELEMTEGVLLSGVEEALGQLHELRALGVRVAIDDFGTGFSSLSYLRDLPVHKLKLDRTFVQQVLTSRDNAAIVKAVIILAHEMALLVVAEGVETPGQREALISYQCDLLQGYFFTKPIPLAKLRALPTVLPEEISDDSP